jgi:hypothetical protein
MAKIVEDVLVVKFSKIVKDSEAGGSLVSAEVATALEQVAQELAGEGMIVEVTQVEQ